MQNLDIKILFNQKEAAEVIGVAVSTLARWRKRGTGPQHIIVDDQVS